MTLEEILRDMEEQKRKKTSVINNNYNINSNNSNKAQSKKNNASNNTASISNSTKRKENLISNTDILKFNISNYKAPNALEYFGNDVKNILDNARQGANRGIISASKYGYGIADLATDYIEKGMEKTLGISDSVSKLLGKNTNFQERAKTVNKKNQETREKIKKSFNNELEGYDEDIQSNIEDTQTPALKKVSELAPSMGNSTFGLAISAIPGGQILAPAYFTSSAGGSYMKEAEDKGATDEKALAYGTALGIAEGATEKLELGWLTKGVKNLGKGMIKEALRNYGINIAENYIQEALMEPIQETANQIVFGESDWNNMLERMNNAGIDGALSALIMDGASSGLGSSINIVNKIQNNETITQADIEVAKKDLRTVTEKISELEKNSNENNQSVANTQMVAEQNANTGKMVEQENVKSAQIRKQRLAELKNIDTSEMKLLERKAIENEIKALENGFSTVDEYKKSEEQKHELAVQKARQERELKKQKENVEEDYRLNHRPTETGANASDISANGVIPSDVYEHPDWYFSMSEKSYQESFKVLNKIRNNPEAEVKIYRASTKNELNEGDWVTLSKTYAEEHNERSLDSKGKIYEYTVKAKDIQYAGDDINEFGYFPQEKKIAPIKEENKVKTVMPISEEIEATKKHNIIDEKVAEYIKSVKDNFESNIDISTKVVNDGNAVPIDYKNEKQVTIYKRARDIFAKIRKKVFTNKNDGEKIYVSNTDINESIRKTITNPDQNKYLIENMSVFSQLDKIIENGKEISGSIEDTKGRVLYRDWKYYVSNVKIDGKPCVVEYDTVINENDKRRHFRLERVYELNEGDLATGSNVNSVNQFGTKSPSVNNIIPRGENYVNNAENNQKITENAPFNPEFKEKQRKRYKTIIESDLVSKEAKMVAKELMGVDTYVPESNVQQLNKADYIIEQLGTERALDSLKSKVDGGQKITGDDIALGDRLIQYYSKTGEKARLQDAIQYTAMAGTEAGRTVQAMSIIAHQSPEGQALWIERSVNKLNQKIATKKGAKIEVIDGKKVVTKKGKNIDLQLFEFTADMKEKLMSAKSNEEMYSVLDEIYEELGQQVPKSTMEKIDSWRYFSMLANPTTHVRNIAGNTAMTGIQGIKNVVAGGIEDVVSLFNKDMERSKSVVRLTNINKVTLKFAMDDIKNVADRLGLNQNKYSPTSRIESNKREFKNDILNKTLGNAYKLNSKLLEVEDGWGLKFNYAKELTEYIVANKYDVNNITDEQLGKARNYAIEKAKEATFHQESKLASTINQIGNNNEITKFIVDSTLPFKSVPINVAKTGLEYSPLQIVKSATVDIVNLRNGKINVNQYIDNVSKGLTGTGIAIVGYALAQAGILKASGSDDDKEKYDEKQGKQTYSIQIGGNTYSLSWLAPTAIPLFIGVEIAENMNSDKNEKGSISSDDDTKYNKAIKSATNILDAFANCMNPMTEMSMLSGLTSTLKSYDQGSTQFLTSLGTNITKSYVNQFVPTALGKVARITDDYERDTTSTKKGVLPKAIDSTINQTMNKIPGLRQMLPTKKDVWGNEVKQTDNMALKLFENTIAPYTRKEISNDKVDKEINTLYDKTKESSIIPKNISKDFIIDGQRYRLTNKEYNEYQTQYGKTTHKTITDVMESSTYKDLSDNEKADIIKEIYSDTKEILKKKFADERKLEYKRSDTDVKIDELVDGGLNVANAYIYKTIVNKIQGDKDKDGKSISGSEATKKANYIYNMKDNDTQKDKLLSLISDTDTKPTMTDLKKLNGDYLTYMQQSGKKNDEGVSQRDKYMMYVDTGIPVKTLNKYYAEIGKIEGVKDSNGKTISGSKKKAIFNYINSLPLSATKKKILFTKSNSSYGKNYKNEIFNYINSLPLSKTRKEQIWKELYD